ncbi:hypothetical protein HOLleu_07926 [Holothuria leucospilota]|uniref:Uncharacterized protein n=1 Tax=Holothuria leucospilota TaxID=206669 RepID=A0A9Q1CHG1_HOLLE|nr:hypothetical protein HOLleu_07926 [Holothuria leucospilota]
MALVESTFKDKKGYVRSCQVRTKTSTFVRPVPKLCILSYAYLLRQNKRNWAFLIAFWTVVYLRFKVGLKFERLV